MVRRTIKELALEDGPLEEGSFTENSITGKRNQREDSGITVLPHKALDSTQITFPEDSIKPNEEVKPKEKEKPAEEYSSKVFLAEDLREIMNIVAELRRLHEEIGREYNIEELERKDRAKLPKEALALQTTRLQQLLWRTVGENSQLISIERVIKRIAHDTGTKI